MDPWHKNKLLYFKAVCGGIHQSILCPATYWHTTQEGKISLCDKLNNDNKPKFPWRCVTLTYNHKINDIENWKKSACHVMAGCASGGSIYLTLNKCCHTSYSRKLFIFCLIEQLLTQTLKWWNWNLTSWC